MIFECLKNNLTTWRFLVKRFGILVAFSLTISALGCEPQTVTDKRVELPSIDDKMPKQEAVAPIPVTGTFLVAADLLPTSGYTLSKKTAEQLVSAIERSKVFYSKQPTSDVAAQIDLKQCITELDSSTIEANKVSAKIVKNLDISTCVRRLTDPSLTIVSLRANLKLYLYLSCSSGDVSGLNGQKFSNILEDIDLGNSGCKEGSLHIQFVSEQTADLVYNNIPTNFTRRVVSLDGTKDLSGCKFSVKDNIESRSDDCINFIKDDYSFESTLATVRNYDIYSYKFVGVSSEVSTENEPWRSSGKIELSVNDWTGQVAFNGSRSAPAFTVKNTDSQATVSGTLKATPIGSDFFAQPPTPQLMPAIPM